MKIQFWKRELAETEEKPAVQIPKGGKFRERIDYANGEETALRVAAVYRAAELRASALATARLQYLTYRGGANYMQINNYGPGRATNYCISVRPNSRQNAMQFWRQVELMRIFHGHCVIYPRVDPDGTLRELIPCHASWDPQANTYQICEPIFGLVCNVPASDVIVIRGICTHANPQGESIIHYAARTASVASTIDSLSLETAAKGGRMKLILQQKENNGMHGFGAFAEEEMQKHAMEMQQAIYENDVVYDDSCSDVKPISMSMADIQLIETKKLSISDISRFFGVPRSLLMDDSNSNYNTAEAATLEFLTRTLHPLLREIEDEFNSKLLGVDDFGKSEYRFDTAPLFALDIKTKMDVNKLRLETGVASVNELRAESNMPKIENGDEHYVSCNVAPVGSAKLSGEAAAAEPAAEPKRERNEKGQFIKKA